MLNRLLRLGIVVPTLALALLALPARAELIAHLPLTEDFKDQSGHHNDGIPAGRAHLVDGTAIGRPGNVVAFGGNGDWIVLPHIPLEKRPFAFAFWLKAGAYPQYGLVEQMDANAPSRLLHLQLRDLRQPRFSFMGGGLYTPVADAVDQDWHHLVFQYTGEKQQIFKDGQLIGEQASPAYQGTRGPTIIGKTPIWDNVPTVDLEGYLSDFRIYDQSLTQEEIKGLATPPATRPTADILEAAVGPTISPRVLVQTTDFIIQVYHNGQPVPLAQRRFITEGPGLATELINLDIHRGDWLVFNVVNDHLRWNGVQLFMAAGVDAAGKVTFRSDESWSCCDDVSQVRRFVSDRSFLAQQKVKPITQPQAAGMKLFSDRYPGSGAKPIWGTGHNTWIKYVAP